MDVWPSEKKLTGERPAVVHLCVPHAGWTPESWAAELDRRAGLMTSEVPARACFRRAVAILRQNPPC